MLKQVKRLNYNAPYTYAPSQEDAAVALYDILSVERAEARGSGPFVRLTLRDGRQWICVGTVADFPLTGPPLTQENYERLCLKIAQAEREVDFHAAKRHQMAKCCALLIKQAVEVKGRKLGDSYKYCGTGQAALSCYLLLAGISPPGWLPDDLLMQNQNCQDILIALGELEKADKVAK